MKPAQLLFLVVPLLAACCADDGRASSTSGAAAASSAPASVTGTLLDAQSGDPVPNVRVHGPRDSSSRSDAQGRFELEGLRAGDEGEITAETGDGRRGALRLRPLRPGRLEVVLYLASQPRND